MDPSTLLLLLLPGVWLGATLGFTVDKVRGETQTIPLQQRFEDVFRNMIGLLKQGKVRESKEKQRWSIITIHNDWGVISGATHTLIFFFHKSHLTSQVLLSTI